MSELHPHVTRTPSALSLVRSLRKVALKLSEVGVRRSLNLAYLRLRKGAFELKISPAYWRFARDEDRFDRAYGTETAQHILAHHLDVTREQRAHTQRYGPVNTEMFATAMRAARVRHEDFVFVDLGSGKGRAMLLASGFPFKKIIGVEFSATLNSIARSNFRVYSNPAQRCFEFELVCADVRDFDLPAEKLILFLHNPFDGCVLSKLVENIGESLALDPRDLYIVYTFCFFDEILRSAAFLELVDEGSFTHTTQPDPNERVWRPLAGGWCVYRSRA